MKLFEKKMLCNYYMNNLYIENIRFLSNIDLSKLITHTDNTLHYNESYFTFFSSINNKDIIDIIETSINKIIIENNISQEKKYEEEIINALNNLIEYANKNSFSEDDISRIHGLVRKLDIKRECPKCDSKIKNIVSKVINFFNDIFIYFKSFIYKN